MNPQDKENMWEEKKKTDERVNSFLDDGWLVKALSQVEEDTCECFGTHSLFQ